MLRPRAGWAPVLAAATLLLLAPPARADGLAEVGFAAAPREVDLGPQGSAVAPVTVFLRVATGCAEATSVPVVVSVAGTDGLRAAFDRAEAVLHLPAGPGPQEARQTLDLHVTGVGPGTLRLDAEARFPPQSCLGLAGAQDRASHAVAVASPATAPPPGQAEPDGTRPIALKEAPPRDPMLPLLVAGAALGIGLLLRARPWKGT
jgi:hypothetical protein